MTWKQETSRGQLVLALIVVPLLILAALWAATPLTEHNAGRDSDGVYYAAMAEQAAGAELTHTAPYCWRVITPFLASLLPFDTIGSFKALALLANWLSLALVYALARESRLSHRAGLLAIFLYAGVFWALRFSFYSPCYIDFMSQTLILGVLVLMLAGAYWPIPLLLTVGVLQKESLLFLAPVVYAHYAQRYGWLRGRSLGYLAALVLPPVAALLAVHGLVQPVNRFSSLGHYLKNMARMQRLGFWPRFALAIFSGLGILPALVAWQARAAYRFLRANLHWLLFAAIGVVSLFGGADKARLFLYLLPLVVLFTAQVLSPLVDRPSPAGWAWLAATLLLHLYLGRFLTPMGSFDEYLNWLVPEYATGPLWLSLARLGLVLLLWLVATGLGLHDRRRAHSLPGD